MSKAGQVEDFSIESTEYIYHLAHGSSEPTRHPEKCWRCKYWQRHQATIYMEDAKTISRIGNTKWRGEFHSALRERSELLLDAPNLLQRLFDNFPLDLTVRVDSLNCTIQTLGWIPILAPNPLSEASHAGRARLPLLVLRQRKALWPNLPPCCQTPRPTIQDERRRAGQLLVGAE